MAYIEVEGLKEFNQAVRRMRSQALNKRLGQANKKIGQLVIDRLSPRPTPAAVGTGKGASVRPSASKREVLLRVGGSHRPKPPLSVWGARRVLRVGQPAPDRPFIQGTAERYEDEIGDAYLTALVDAFGPAFYEAS